MRIVELQYFGAVQVPVRVWYCVNASSSPLTCPLLQGFFTGINTEKAI
jgi:hypothetical protein